MAGKATRNKTEKLTFLSKVSTLVFYTRLVLPNYRRKVLKSGLLITIIIIIIIIIIIELND